MTVDERREKIIEQLDLKVLEAWPNNLAEKAQDLLREYHNIFTLEPNEQMNWVVLTP